MPVARSVHGARAERADDDGYEPLPLADIARAAMRRVAELTGRQPSGVTSLEASGDGWAVEAEVVEDCRIPSSGDILALYRVRLSADGELVSLRRIGRRQRGDVT
jgi:hypothetical protein